MQSLSQEQRENRGAKGKLVKSMGMIVKLCGFNDSDSGMLLFFLEQFKRICDSNEVCKSVSM